jgi:hypothetical protein
MGSKFDVLSGDKMQDSVDVAWREQRSKLLQMCQAYASGKGSALLWMCADGKLDELLSFVMMHGF